MSYYTAHSSRLDILVGPTGSLRCIDPVEGSAGSAEAVSHGSTVECADVADRYICVPHSVQERFFKIGDPRAQ